MFLIIIHNNFLFRFTIWRW